MITSEDSLRKVVIDNLELQKSILVQELATYEFTDQPEAAAITKQKLDEVEEHIRRLRRGQKKTK
jgi:hypothetical protein